MMKRIELYIIIFLTPLIVSKEILDVNVLRLPVFSSLLILLLFYIFMREKNDNLLIDKKLLFFYLILIGMLSLNLILHNTSVFSNETFLLINAGFILSYFVYLFLEIAGAEKFIKLFVLVNSLVLLIVSSIGILQALDIIPFDLPAIAKPGSTMVSRNFAAAYTITVLPLAVLASSLFKKYRYYFYMILIIALFYLLILRGRASLVVLSIYLFLSLIYALKNWNSRRLAIKKVIVSVIIIAPVLFAGITASFTGLSRKSFEKTIDSIIEVDHPLNQKRVSSWVASIKMFSDHPFTGVGLESWKYEIFNYNREYYNDKNMYHNSFINPHNIYLEILSETGIFTFTIFIIFLLVTFYLLLKKVKEDNRYFFLILSFISFLVISFFSFPHKRVDMVIIFFTLIGLAYHNSGNFTKISKFILSPALFIILSIVTGLFVLRYSNEKQYEKSIAYKFAGNYGQCIYELNKINEDIFPVDLAGSPISYYKGVCYYNLRDYKSALHEFDKAFKISPNNPLNLNNLANAYYKLGKINKAISILRMTGNKFPNYLEPQINLLAMYTNESKINDALTLLDKIKRKKNDSIRNLILLNKIEDYYYENN